MNVLDTSVVTKWFFREPGSDLAVELLRSEKEFFAPDYLRIEFFSNVSKKVRAGQITIEEGRELQDKFEKISFQLVPYKKLENMVFEFSTQYPITYYDSIFIALAYSQRSKLYTFDKRLKRSVEETALDRLVIIPE